MQTGFKDQSIDIGDVYVTRDWLISHYPELASGLTTRTNIQMYGGGWGMMGDGVNVDVTTPRLLGELASASGPINNNPWTKLVNRGSGGGAAIKFDSSLWVWGNNNYGQLGDGTTITKSSPVAFGAGSSWKTASCGGSFFHAIRSDGALFAVGYGTTGLGGLLGDGTTIDRSSPVQVGTSSWTAIASSGSHVLAIRQDGTLWAWGADKWAQGSSAVSSSPVQIGTSSWTVIAAGGGISFGIRSDGTLWRWGGSAYGGNGDNTNGFVTSTPTQIGTNTNWRAVAVNQDAKNIVAAIDNNNKLFTWGYNANGALGDGTTINKSSPVQIGGSTWSTVTVGESQIAAIAVDGTLWTWGAGGDGALGDGYFDRSSPVQIATLWPTLRFYDVKYNSFNLVGLTDGGAI